MNSQEVPTIVVASDLTAFPLSGDCETKYLMAEVIDKDGNKVTIVRAPMAYWHEEIEWGIDDEFAETGFKVKILGGGRIYVNVQETKVTVLDRSTDYGPGDNQKVAELIGPLFPGYKVIWSSR